MKGSHIMTTIQDIADKMNVSKSTVSKALNDAPDISETLRKQVLETAVALGYTKLRRYKKPVKKICIITEKENIQYEEPHHFAYDILLGFRQMAEPAGFDIEIVPVDVQMQRNQRYDVFMLEHDYVGAFAIGFSLNDPWIQDFKTSHTPAVLFDNYIIGKTSSDSTGCSYYLSECMEKHLPRFLKKGMTAIICSQDTLANSALIQCQQLGYRIPEDISIIGFDDIPIAAYTSPPLTTIRQDRLELGKSGFFALSSLLNSISISTFLLHAQLIERKSTGEVPVT